MDIAVLFLFTTVISFFSGIVCGMNAMRHGQKQNEPIRQVQ